MSAHLLERPPDRAPVHWFTPFAMAPQAQAMPLIIDGYNLLHGSGILGGGVGPGGLERARRALLNFLVESLSDRELNASIIVFDANDSGALRTRQSEHRGLEVRFATAGESADDLIERLIAAHSAPRRLTVVSSDHRLHRAARRRRATAVDSDIWFARTVRARREQPIAGASAETLDKPSDRLSEVEIQFWIKQFGLDCAVRGETHTGPASIAPPAGAPTSPPAAPTPAAESPTPASPGRTGTESAPVDRPDRASGSSHTTGPIWLPPATPPFPPGYGEDIGPDDV